MARYGEEFQRGGRGAGRRRGRRWDDEPGYGPPPEAGRRYRRDRYGAAPGYGREYRAGYGAEYGPELGYGEDLGYGEELGYDIETGYGPRPGYGREPEYPTDYDYEFGGRGWPYRERIGGWRRYGGGEPGYGAEFGDEMRRPGYRRGWPAAPRRGAAWRGRGARATSRGGRTRERFPGAGGARYGRDFGPGRVYGGRMVERGYEEEPMSEYELEPRTAGRFEPRTGPTPPDRWPDIGHDVDHRPARERQMSDDEVREVVLENLFQDTWVDPDRIDVEVDRGVVTLTGEVRDFMEARYAWDDAWESAGVRGVINNLTVRADRPQSEMDMPQTAGSRKGRA